MARGIVKETNPALSSVSDVQVQEGISKTTN